MSVISIINLRNDICTFSHILSAASGFQTGIKRKREEEDDGDLNIDGDDSEEYGKPQYPIKLVYLFVNLSVKLVYLCQMGLLLCQTGLSVSNWLSIFTVSCRSSKKIKTEMLSIP